MLLLESNSDELYQAKKITQNGFYGGEDNGCSITTALCPAIHGSMKMISV